MFYTCPLRTCEFSHPTGVFCLKIQASKVSFPETKSQSGMMKSIPSFAQSEDTMACIGSMVQLHLRTECKKTMSHLSEILYIDGERYQALSRLTQAKGIDVASQQ